MNEMNWNERENLHLWVDLTLENAKGLEESELVLLREIGHKVVDEGGWRGDISEAWREVVPRINGAMMDLFL